MWTRAELKTAAKTYLRGSYWKAFIVCLIVSILAYAGRIGPTGNRIMSEVRTSGVGIDHINILFDAMLAVILAFTIVFLIVKVVIGLNIEVGQARFFLKGFEGESNIGDTFSVFYKGEYGNIFKIQLLRFVRTFLWSLLLVIPGIIKSYEYSMIPYILAENPDINMDEAFLRSKQLTMGHKWDMFILALSFILWDILGAMLFGIGGYFIQPYKTATEAKLYVKLTGGQI